MHSPNTPVIVGVGAINNRSDAHDAEPIAAMVQAATAALADSSVARPLARRIESVRVVQGIWPYQDPGAMVAAQLALSNASHTLRTNIGGNGVYDLIGQTADQIQRGELSAALVCASETMRTRRRDRAAGRASTYLAEPDGAQADEVWPGDRSESFLPVEAAIDIHHPVNFYALCEVALRHERQESPALHLDRVSSLWAQGSTIASQNPDAWLQEDVDAERIRTVDAGNRMVAHPYPKLMTSNVNVDQSAAVVMCSAEVARDLGIPESLWVHVHAHTGAADAQYPSHRGSMAESPAMRVAGRRVFELAGIGPDDLARHDLYSCFPAAVQMAQRELGLDPTQPFTITGGLTFAGGPLNSYCLQALVRGVELARENDAGGPTLLTGNGGFFSKHSFLVIDAQPSANGFGSARPQAEVDTYRHRALAGVVPSKATVEAYTATYDRQGDATRAVIACLTDGGERLWATSTDAGYISHLHDADRVGESVNLRPPDDLDAPTGLAEVNL